MWKESLVPSGYIAAHGSVTLGAIGRRLGRSIAAAASRGVCILDLAKFRGSSGHRASMNMEGTYSAHQRHSPCVSGSLCTDSNEVPGGMKNVHPKWRVFRSEAEESSFRVEAMGWWERSTLNDDGLEASEITSEDMLIAVVQYLPSDLSVPSKNEHDDGNQLYLVCWSRRR